MNKSFQFNPIQRSNAIWAAWRQVDVWGRGGGKSTDAAWKIISVNELLPRFTNAISGETYQQILTKTIPTTIDGLGRLGLVPEVDFVIGKKPDPKLEFEKPYASISNYERLITFKNGTTWVLSSQDRPGANRGMNLGFVYGDEMLTQDRKKFQDELLAGLRGNIDRVKKDNPYIHGWNLKTSMPTTAKGKWILDFADYYEEDGAPIWISWNKLCQLQLKFIRAKDAQEIDFLKSEIIKLKKSIQFYPSKKGILFTLANAFDNIKALGLDYLKEQYQVLSEFSFRTEILNEYVMMEERSFYKIDEEKHCYTHYDYGYLDSLEYNREKLENLDSRQDADVDQQRPLDIAIDFGANINGIRVAQPHANDFKGSPSDEYRFLKSIYVKYPLGIKEVGNKFCDYFTYHRCKEVNLPYDHTAVGRDPVRDRFIDEFVKVLTERGWKVNLFYLGQTTGHHNRYLLWEILLRGNDPRFPKILFNRNNDWDGILSMMLAPLIQGRNGFEKDKRSERSKTIPDEQATHLSDAADTLVVWRFLSRLEESRGGFEMLTR